MIDIEKIKTLGDLKNTDYKPLSINEELRKNLIAKMQNDESIFQGMHSYERTVIPEVELAILAGHNILFLGLRGQGKTRMARQLVQLLDEYIPVISNLAIPDDPLNPITKMGQHTIQEKGDDTPIEWLHRSDRIVEKLATPDVSVADLIGDVDPIKAASLKLPYSDERVIHYGLIPRAHRSIFILNELPDLQPRIQVSLFNILEEGDIQIRGFKLRMPLDIQFVFTANPEDYTNRGSIITPLKDRIESQIMTHYSDRVEEVIRIARQEAQVPSSYETRVKVPPIIERILAEAMLFARRSDFIDHDSGVSERMNIAMRELLYASVMRRILRLDLESDTARIIDLYSVMPAITGKMELTYEGEQEGMQNVAMHILGEAIEIVYSELFDEEELQKRRQPDFIEIKTFFEKGNQILLSPHVTSDDYKETLENITGLNELVSKVDNIDKNNLSLYKELVIFGFTEVEVLNKELFTEGIMIEDPLGDMFSDLDDFGLEEDEY